MHLELERERFAAHRQQDTPPATAGELNMSQGVRVEFKCTRVLQGKNENFSRHYGGDCCTVAGRAGIRHNTYASEFAQGCPELGSQLLPRL